jgi:hypothetical protein
MDKKQFISEAKPYVKEFLGGALEKVENECIVPEKPDFRNFNAISLCIAIGYFVILIAVLIYVFVARFGSIACHADCNNYSLLLVSVMILATIVLLTVLNAISHMKRTRMEEYYKGLEKYNRMVSASKSYYCEDTCKKMMNLTLDMIFNDFGQPTDK